MPIVNYKNSLFLPEIFTHTSIKLNAAPLSSDLPPSGYVYIWESMTDGVLYVYAKDSNGDTYTYNLTQTTQLITTEPIISDEIEPFEWTSANMDTTIVSGKKYLVVTGTYAISEINVYMDANKATSKSICAGTYNNGTNILVDFTDVDSSIYQYGGNVKFAQGTSIQTNFDEYPYIISNATGITTINANNGLHQVIASVTTNVILEKNYITNLETNKVLKVRVDNPNMYPALIFDTYVYYSSFYVLITNIGSTIKQLGEIVKVD